MFKDAAHFPMQRNLNKNNCALCDQKMCSSECPWEREILLLLAWLFCIYILGRRLTIVEDLVAVRITRMFVMSSHGGKTKVDLPPSYFRTWLTLGNKGDWLWKTGKQQRWKQRCCSLSIERLPDCAKTFFFFIHKLWLNKLMQCFYWSITSKW